MQMLAARRYVTSGLEASPLVLSRLLEGISEAELDQRLDPERFTLREVVAHLADFEPIWRERMRRMVEEENPELPSYDEGQLAIDHDYARSNAAEQLALYTSEREKTVAYVQSLPAEAWTRTGIHSQWGAFIVADLIALTLGHDGYHLRQAVEYRTGSK